MKDNFNRDIKYMRISVTDRCNLRCKYCMPAEGLEHKQGHSDILSFDEIIKIVRVAHEFGIEAVRITGGEPLVRKGVSNLIAQLSKFVDVSLTTNATLLPIFADELKEAGLKRINISIDTLDAQAYREITRVGTLSEALNGLDTALDAGFDPVKINAVAMRGINQNYNDFVRLTFKKPVHVRFIEYMHIGDIAGKYISEDEIKSQIDGELIPVKGPTGEGPAHYYQLDGALGSIGFITSQSNHFCKSCNRIRLTADGKIRPCLFSDVEYDIRNANIEEVLKKAILNKPVGHEGKLGTARHMSQIGG